MFKKHAAQLLAESAAPEVRAAISDALAIPKPTLRDIDDTVWKKMGRETSPFPFEDVDVYYLWASSHEALKDVKVPCLVINSSDDPIVRALPEYEELNPHVMKVTTQNGGHLGWFESKKGEWFGVERWTTEVVMEWLVLMGEKVTHNRRRWPQVEVDNQGFLVEHGGDPSIGCKYVEGSECIVDGCLENQEEDLIQGL